MVPVFRLHRRLFLSVFLHTRRRVCLSSTLAYLSQGYRLTHQEVEAFWRLSDVIIMVLLKPNCKEAVVTNRCVLISQIILALCHVDIEANLLMALPWLTHIPWTGAAIVSEALATLFPPTYPCLFSVMTYWSRMCFGNVCYWSPPLSVFRASCPAFLILTRS